MTPKEKVIELEERFRLNVLDYEGCSINSHKAKQCVLIAVDEIILTCKNIKKLYEDNGIINSDIDWQAEEFWQEVKQELTIFKSE